MIRNAIIHLLNEQPITADLFGAPSASDVSLVCTNLRTTNGKRPTYVDQAGSTFVFPYTQVRFVEIHAGSLAGSAGASLAADPADAVEEGQAPADDEDLEIDEDFLRRVRDA